MFNDSWKTGYSLDEDDENAKNTEINHPTTLNWAIAETEETLKDQREGDKLLKPIFSWGPERKLIKHAGTSVLQKIIAPKQTKDTPSTFNDYYTYLMGEGEDDDDEGGYY